MNIEFDKLDAHLPETFDWFDEDHLADISDDKTRLFNCADNYESTEDFEKTDTKPTPQYYLKSSWDEKKEWLTKHTLQSYFGKQKLKDYWVLLKLGTGLLVIDNKNKIPIVGILVNLKQRKHKQKDTPAPSPLLEIVGMDISYGGQMFLVATKMF